LQSLGEARHEPREAGLERHRVEQPEHPAEGVAARNAMPQVQELPQERPVELAEKRRVRAILAAGQHGAERNQQQLIQGRSDEFSTREFRLEGGRGSRLISGFGHGEH
jgi:hypothetical protein